MKINPWIVVSLLALVCGFLLGSRVENEAEAETPKYQYFIDTELGINSGRYQRVDIETGMFQLLEKYAINHKSGAPQYFWKDCYMKFPGSQ